MAQKNATLVSVANDVLPLERWVGYRFGLIAQRIGLLAAKHYTKRYRLKTNLWRALAVVARFGPLSASELSLHSRLDPPKVSRAIDALVERKLLLRRTDRADERRAILTLTARGRAIHNDVAAFTTALEHTLTQDLTNTERETLWRALSKIDKRLMEVQRDGFSADGG